MGKLRDSERPPASTSPVVAENGFDERAIRQVLERAAELQRRAGPATVAPPAAQQEARLTLSELERIAQDAGIDPRHVRTAAAERTEGGRGLLGGPTAIVLAEELEGVLGEPELAALAEEIRHAFADEGTTELTAGGLVWRSSERTPPLEIRVEPAGARTRIHARADLAGLEGALLGGFVIGVGGLGAILLGAAVVLGLAAAIGGAVLVPVAYLGARAIYTRARERRAAQLGSAMSRVTEKARAAARRPS